MRQAMRTPDVNSRFSIIEGCAVLMPEEVHSGSPDMEMILARILPKLKIVTNFKRFLWSTDLEVSEFVQRAKEAGLEDRFIKCMDTSGRHQQLQTFCLAPDTPAVGDNIELAVRAVITLHHQYAQGYPDKKGYTDGTILVFVPGKPEILAVIDLLKAAMRRGFTAGLFPFGFHSDIPAKDKDFLFKGTADPNKQ